MTTLPTTPEAAPSPLPSPLPEYAVLRQRFRDAMANLPAAVNILTTAGPAGRCGITATAVCSVSDTPPTLLFCVNTNSAALQTFEANGQVCVNVLPGECDGLARDFAGMTGLSMEERFARAAWRGDEADLPQLASALVNFTGRIVQVVRVGTHAVIFAEIDTVQIRGEADALVYFDRNFRRISRAVEVIPA